MHALERSLLLHPVLNTEHELVRRQLLLKTTVSVQYIGSVSLPLVTPSIART